MKAIRVRVSIAAAVGLLFLGSQGLARAAASAAAGAPGSQQEQEVDPFEKKGGEAATVPPLPDPIQPVNRAFYHVNDKLYFWLVRPVARGYKAVTPHSLRVGVRNFFGNLGAPSRSVNCLLQGDLRGTGTELARFAVNTTAGVAGLGDPARKWLKLNIRREDFGQTLGYWGLGMWFYIDWPLIGSSCPRDTVGALVNSAMDPATYFPGASLVARINNTTFGLGEYEAFKKQSLDPYVAIRDAYNQNRQFQVAHWD